MNMKFQKYFSEVSSGKVLNPTKILKLTPLEISHNDRNLYDKAFKDLLTMNKLCSYYFISGLLKEIKKKLKRKSRAINYTQNVWVNNIPLHIYTCIVQLLNVCAI